MALYNVWLFQILQKHQSQIPLNLNHGQLIEQLSGTVSKLEVLAQQETDRSKELPGGFGSPQKSPRKSPGSKLRSDLQKTALTMRLATSASHVLTTKEDDQKIFMKLSVPQTKIVSSSSNKHPYPGGEDSTTDTGGRERGEKAGREEVVMASGHRRRESGGEGGRGGEGEAKRRAGRLNRRTRKKCMKEDVQRMLTRKVRRIQG
ncbi:hypothetical protein GBAR_LOCUS25447 [Geodia barretti]|uniref:Uncharacterized protein n=1 Tax=Geodia barretti TaxID=519541 RepID=A0AA35TFJ9_GEOBA|nr:hypothetical protein GBAR_LOCUS25447 [Geodia barretti]